MNEELALRVAEVWHDMDAYDREVVCRDAPELGAALNALLEDAK